MTSEQRSTNRQLDKIILEKGISEKTINIILNDINSKKIIVLKSEELSDLYALKVLGDVLEKDKRLSVYYDIPGFLKDSISSDRLSQILDTRSNKPGLVRNSLFIIQTHSDVNDFSDYSLNKFYIDTSILKNCINPTDQQTKINLRKYYGLKEEERIAVMGFARTIRSIEEIHFIKSIIELVDRFIFVGRLDRFALNFDYFEEKDKEKIEFVTSYGVMSDYYALADFNFIMYWEPNREGFLHNFVEQTQGGPLFYVKFDNFPQFGYKELISIGAIQLYDSFEDFRKQCPKKISYFISNPSSYSAVMKQRAAHLINTKQKFLPVIMQFIEKMVFCKEEERDFDSIKLNGLKFKNKSGKILIYHPETRWTLH